MSNSKVHEQIFVPLDAILDTRLGTIAKMGSHLVDKVLETGTYHTRDTDLFSGVDPVEFNRLYAARDEETLARSYPTNMLGTLQDLAESTTKEMQRRPSMGGPRIVVNLYPYELSPLAENEIGRALAVWMAGIAPVELVRIPPKDLTPEFCRSSYRVMIAYEYEAWMEMHAAAFMKTRPTQLPLLVPAIYFKPKPTEEQIKEMVVKHADPMRALEMMASPLINLQVIDTEKFSIISIPDRQRPS